jgi:hypothetical protein
MALQQHAAVAATAAAIQSAKTEEGQPEQGLPTGCQIRVFRG